MGSSALVVGRTWMSSSFHDVRYLMERVTLSMPCDEAGVSRYIRDFMVENPSVFKGKAWAALRLLLPYYRSGSLPKIERLAKRLVAIESRLFGDYLVSSDAFASFRESAPSPSNPVRYLGLHSTRPCGNQLARFDFDDAGVPVPRPSGESAQSLYTSKGCAACHGAKAQGKVGPPLAGIEGSQVNLENGEQRTRDRVYLRRAILEPGSDIVHNYTNAMPSYRGRLTDEQVELLLDMLKEL